MTTLDETAAGAMHVTPGSPTLCAATGEPMTWDGTRWVHKAGVCADTGHLGRLDEIAARVADCRTYNFGMRAADKLAHDDAPTMLAAIQAVEAAHVTKFYDPWGHEHDTSQGRGGWCGNCGRFDGEGCRTITAIRESLGHV